MPRVIVVDDDPGFIDLMTELLEEWGWDLVTCSQAESALACVKRDQPDAVLLDIRLNARQSGWDILDGLQADPTTSTIPVVICSAAADELRSHASWLHERGMGVLPKPFDIEELYSHVEAAGTWGANKQTSA